MAKDASLGKVMVLRFECNKELCKCRTCEMGAWNMCFGEGAPCALDVSLSIWGRPQELFAAQQPCAAESYP